MLEYAISVAEKEATLAALWRVVYADEINKEVEDRLLHEIEAVLGVGPERAKALQDAAHG